MAINTVSNDVPPWLMNGKGAPTTGIKPETMPIFIETYKKINKEIPNIIDLFNKLFSLKKFFNNKYINIVNKKRCSKAITIEFTKITSSNISNFYYSPNYDGIK